MPHELPPLPYEKSALEPFMDTQTMEIHHGKHHATYVANLNKVLAGQGALESKPLEAVLGDLASVPENIRTGVRNNGGGVHNHSMFWKIMAPGAGGVPGGKLGDDIKAAFGSFETFKEKFEAAGLGRFGSGWVWLVVNAGRLEIVSTPNQDNPIMGKAIAGCEGRPIMLCDLWEHAYYLKYHNRRVDFLKAWWNLVNWIEVSRLYDLACK